MTRGAGQIWRAGLLAVIATLVVAPGGAAVEAPKTGVFPFYPYTARYDIWAFTPMDQGGRLVQLQAIGSERDEEIVAAIGAPDFFAPWGNPIRWDSLESSELEKSVWLNRWYFLPSLARMYHLTGDKAHLQEVLRFVRQWRDDNPRPADIAAYIASRQRNWRDMQVAWRVQNLAWCYFLGIEGFTPEEKRELQDIIEVHASVLLEDFGTRPLNENNHQSHGATTMLFASLLFPEIRNADALTKKAIAILEHHLENAFYADGNSVELCPGYYPFFVSIFRDAYLLCRANGVEPPRGSEHRLRQFYDYLRHVAQPDGTMPPINDSSESESGVAARVLEDLFQLPVETGPRASHRFEVSHQAVMHDERSEVPAYVFLDAGPQVTSHWHSGKLGFHLWFWDKPMLVDSGISNYDDPLKRSWYIQPDAHNTLLVDGRGDYARAATTRLAERPWAGSRIEHWESNERYDWAAMVHDGVAEGVRWTRHFVLVKGLGAVVIDRLESEREHDYTWLFHLSPGQPTLDRDTRAIFSAATEKNLLLVAAGGEGSVELRDGTINRRSRNFSAPVAAYRIHGRTVDRSYLLLPVAGAKAPKVGFSQEVLENGVRVSLSTPSGSAEIELNTELNNRERVHRITVEETRSKQP